MRPRPAHFDSDGLNRHRPVQHFPIRVEGMSATSVDDFCNAIEFAALRDTPTDGELDHLRGVLRAIARDSHASGRLPEQGLMALRKAWALVCQVGRPPDMHDPSWHIIVREWLGAFEAERH